MRIGGKRERICSQQKVRARARKDRKLRGEDRAAARYGASTADTTDVGQGRSRNQCRPPCAGHTRTYDEQA